MKYFVAAAAALLATSSPAFAQQISGDWQGAMEQEGGRPYPVAVSFGADGRGQIAYTQQGCSGELIPLAQQGPYSVYHEHVLVGVYDPAKPEQNGCIDGVLTFFMVGEALYMNWAGVSDGLVVRAQAYLDPQ